VVKTIVSVVSADSKTWTLTTAGVTLKPWNCLYSLRRSRRLSGKVMSSADSPGSRDSKTRIGPRSGKPKTLQITPSISMSHFIGIELGDWAQLLF
jgi:hypothetical protein